GAEVKKGDVVLVFDTSELVRKLEEEQNRRDSRSKEIEKKLSDMAMSERDGQLHVAEAEGKVRKAGLKVERPADLTGAIELRTSELEAEISKQELTHEAKKLLQQRKQDLADLVALREKRTRAEERVREMETYIKRMSVPSPRDGTVIYFSNW